MIPFRLQEIGYNIDDGSQVGWIMSSYAIGTALHLSSDVYTKQRGQEGKV